MQAILAYTEISISLDFYGAFAGAGFFYAGQTNDCSYGCTMYGYSVMPQSHFEAILRNWISVMTGLFLDIG